LERVGASYRDPITALRETVEAIWKVVEQAASEPALDTSRHDARALLARQTPGRLLGPCCRPCRWWCKLFL